MSLVSPSMSGGRSHTPVKCISFPLLPCAVPDLGPRSPRPGEGCWAWGSGDVPRGMAPARLSFRKTSSRRSICLGFFLANSSTSAGWERHRGRWDSHRCNSLRVAVCFLRRERWSHRRRLARRFKVTVGPFGRRASLPPLVMRADTCNSEQKELLRRSLDKKMQTDACTELFRVSEKEKHSFPHRINK